MKPINTLFECDTLEVWPGKANPIVFVDVNDDAGVTCLQLSPKQARRLAKALKKAADKADR